MIGTHGRDSYNILPTQIKFCRGAKGNWPLEYLVQLRRSNFQKQSSHQEIPPYMLNRPILPLQWGNLEMLKRPSLLRPRPVFEHGSLIKHLMPEKHLFRVLRTYNSVTEGVRR